MQTQQPGLLRRHGSPGQAPHDRVHAVPRCRPVPRRRVLARAGIQHTNRVAVPQSQPLVNPYHFRYGLQHAVKELVAVALVVVPAHAVAAARRRRLVVRRRRWRRDCIPGAVWRWNPGTRHVYRERRVHYTGCGRCCRSHRWRCCHRRERRGMATNAGCRCREAWRCGQAGSCADKGSERGQATRLQPGQGVEQVLERRRR